MLAEQELALLLVHALRDIGANPLGHLQLGEMILRPLQHEVDADARFSGLEHGQLVVVGRVAPRGHAVGEGRRVDRRAQQVGQPP